MKYRIFIEKANEKMRITQDKIEFDIKKMSKYDIATLIENLKIAYKHKRKELTNETRNVLY